MIGLVDYGLGNLHSVEKALEHVGAPVTRVTRGDELDACAALVVPGQGAFRDCVASLHRNELWDALQAWLRADRPYLGICLGMQALFEVSHENGDHHGLAFLPGSVEHFPEGTGLKVPQIGWNRVHSTGISPLFDGLPPDSHFYFCHSYYVRTDDPAVVAGETEYGQVFPSAVSRGNCHAVQFHPEKSQAAGLKLLENFVKRL